MGKSKRKRVDPTGPSITPLAPKAISAAETPVKSATVLQAAASSSSTPQSTPKVDRHQLRTVNSSHSLRQLTATAQAQQFSGNQAGFLKVQYLAKVAEWAATAVPNLGAFFGQRLAAASEALAVSPPTSYTSCQRCETILQVGENCSVRVTKAPKKWRKAKARGVDGGVQSAVVYHCHFCKFGNKITGTAKGHVKTKLSESAALSQMKKLGSSKPATATPVLSQHTKVVGSSMIPTENLAMTPATTKSKKLGSNKTVIANPQVGKVAQVVTMSSQTRTASSPVVFSLLSPNSGTQDTGGGKKRKRKGWSTLKDMANAQLELPTPSRLGFMTPVNPNNKG